jgi:hypothetical protein
MGTNDANPGSIQEREVALMSLIRIAPRSTVGILITVCALALATHSVHAQEMGYSYMQFSVNGKHAQNVPRNPSYNGWMQIESVLARRRLATLKMDDSPPNSPVEAAYGSWSDFPKILQDGKSGPGQMEFGVGDEGGLDPLLDAQKRHLLIPQVELDHYAEIGNQFVGKFILRGVRVLSLKDALASACPMYEVRISFQSISKN